MSAAAFGCKGILVVGQRQFDFSVDGKDVPGSIQDHIAKTMSIKRFEKWEQCVNHLSLNKIELVGVEIHKDAVNIEEFNSTKEVAFVMGNEGQGLHPKHMASCDSFVKISQYGGGTASLNVYVAASIVLHRYHMRIRLQNE